MTVTLAVHQPNYLPWLGWFHKLAAADVFVYLDAVQFPRGRSFAARNRIKTPNGVAWLTVPVSVPKGRDGKATWTFRMNAPLALGTRITATVTDVDRRDTSEFGPAVAVSAS